jgi:RHS repeat-associated protein
MSLVALRHYSMSTSPSLFALPSGVRTLTRRLGLWCLAVCSTLVLSVPASAMPVLSSSWMGAGVPSCSDSYGFNVTVKVMPGFPDGSYSIYSVNRAGNGTTHPITISNGVPSPASFSVVMGFGSESGGYGGGPYTASIQHNTGIYASGITVNDFTGTWRDAGGRRGNPEIGPPCIAYRDNVTVTFGEPTVSPENTKCTDVKLGGDGGCENCHGMARYTIHAMLVSLNLVDTPLSYSPPRGSAIDFTVTYNQRENQQPASFNYSNLGPKWTFNWLSSVIDDPNAQQSRTLVSTRSGGAEVHAFQATTGDFAPDPQSHAGLIRTGAASYEKHYPDGSKEIFDLSDGATVSPRRIFMTQKVDPLGNTLTIGYDSSFRVTTITDAIGQVTAVSYELANDPLKITKVTDPFGRFATFEYAGGKLVKITDPVGIQSQFAYVGGTDFISSLTTPYGTTTFVSGENGTNRWIETTDPLGGKERVEYRDHAPGISANESPIPNASPIQNAGLDTGNTFFWDKRAMVLAPGNYTKARVTHWRSDGNGVISGIVASKREPLENRVWYAYADSSASPSKIARVLDDGTTQLFQYEYNSYGRLTKMTDPAGRSTSSIYDSNNIDLLEVRQTTGSLNDLLASYTYNSQHRPLTATDASGQTTTSTYYPSGQIHTVTNAKQETTTYTYDPNGYLLNVVGAVPGAITSFTYDSFGRRHTATDSEGYTVTTDYDSIDGDPTQTLNRIVKLTYGDGTFEETTYDRLDPEWSRDRLGRWSRRFYDSLQHVVATQDPLNQFTLFDWCSCGALDGMTDPSGNETTWSRDLQNRVTDRINADASKYHYSYESGTSRLASITDPKGQTTNYAYFPDDNIKQISYANAQIVTPTVTYTYDASYNRVLTMADGTGLTTYAYYPVATGLLGAGKLASADGPLDNDTVMYSYDELNRTSGRTINGSANTSSVQYDALGRPEFHTTSLGTFTYQYLNATGQLRRVDYPNGQRVEYDYFDNAGNRRLKTIANFDAGSSEISRFDYTYDSVGSVLTWTQRNSGSPGAKRFQFGYDAIGSLRDANVTDADTGAVVDQYAYDYDRSGNRTSTQTNNTVTTTSPNRVNEITSKESGGKLHVRGTTNEPAVVTVEGSVASTDALGGFHGTAHVVPGDNTITVVATDVNGNARTNNYQIHVASTPSVTPTYDPNGNLTSDGSKTYEWDAANRLVAINYPNSNRTEFVYDGLNRRVRVTEIGTVATVKNLVWCDTEICEERDDSNGISKRFFTDGAQIGSSKIFYTRDHLGSIRELTDDTGAVQSRYDYSCYGQPTKVSGSLDTDFAFTGHYYHGPSGLHLTLYRAYDAGEGRWINRDPIGEQGGLNLYRYVSNNPVNLTDPLGLTAFTSALPWAGGAAAADGPLPIGDVVAAAILAGAAIYDMSQPGEGTGRCSRAEYGVLSAAVAEAKAAVGVLGGCNESDCCTRLKAKKAAWLFLAVARSRLNVRCFNGGDQGHQEATADAWQNVGKCDRIIATKCR